MLWILPLAVAFAWLVSLVYKPAFVSAAVVGYWLTNVLGFVLMQKGGWKMISSETRPYSRREIFRDVLISLLYTLLIAALLKFKILQPIPDYFRGK